MTDLHLPARWLRMIEAVLAEHVPDAEVWAYGSRVDGTHYEGSDLDLMVRGPGLADVPLLCLDALTDGFGASDIPILVEVHDWARVPDAFREEALRKHVVVRKPD